jgi:HSP20 family protein
MNLTLFNTNGRSIHRHDPFALARELLRFDPFVPMQRTAERSAGRPDDLAPAFDVKETEEAYVIQADLPGVTQDQLEITLENSQLRIGGSRQAEEKKEGESYHVWERRCGSFARTFSLPREVDGDRITAKLENGVLTVTLPKKAEAKARKIPLK